MTLMILKITYPGNSVAFLIISDINDAVPSYLCFFYPCRMQKDTEPLLLAVNFMAYYTNWFLLG